MPELREVFAPLALFKRVERMLINHFKGHTGGLPGGGTIDEMPVFTGGPSVFTMPQAYVQSSIDCAIGVVRLVPGAGPGGDFTTSGTTFTLDATHWPSGTNGQRFVVWRARRS